jgi:DNA-binding transcriptional LysR family regulator
MPTETVKDAADLAYLPSSMDRSRAALSADIISLRRSGLIPTDCSSLARLLGRLRFRHLSLLVALDDHRNLHRAAAAINLSQPTASKAVQDLESLFRSPLFDRVPTGMQPTELGDVVLAFARRTLGELKRVAATVDHRRTKADEALVIGVSADIPADTVAQAMTDMKHLRPELLVKVICDANDRIVSQLIAGDFDLAVGHLGERIQPGIIDYEAIGHDSLRIFARPAHPLAQAPLPPMHNLRRAAWILPSRSSSPRQLMERVFRRAGLSPPDNVVESDSLPLTLNMVLRSDVLAVLPERAASRLLDEGQVIRLPIALDRVEFGILTRPDETLSAPVLEFRQVLRSYGFNLCHTTSSSS